MTWPTCMQPLPMFIMLPEVLYPRLAPHRVPLMDCTTRLSGKGDDPVSSLKVIHVVASILRTASKNTLSIHEPELDCEMDPSIVYFTVEGQMLHTGLPIVGLVNDATIASERNMSSYSPG